MVTNPTKAPVAVVLAERQHQPLLLLVPARDAVPRAFAKTSVLPVPLLLQLHLQVKIGIFLRSLSTALPTTTIPLSGNRWLLLLDSLFKFDMGLSDTGTVLIVSNGATTMAGMRTINGKLENKMPLLLQRRLQPLLLQRI